MRKERPRWRGATAWMVLGLQLVTLLTPVLRAAPALAQADDVEQGQQYYEQSRFDEAITLLKDLVDRGALSGIDLLKAREILARSYVKKGYPVRAREMFKDILKQDPTWRPDPIRVPPDETAVFEQALREFDLEQQGPPPTEPDTTAVPPTTPPSETPPPTTPPPTTTQPPPPTPVPAATVIPVQEKKKSNTLWWVLGGAAAAGIIVAVASGGGGGDGGGGGGGGTTLPAFPPPPTKARSTR